MPRPIQAYIDQNALQNNLSVARRSTSSRIMAVIKANGYGHGLLRVAEALAGADGFALLDIPDAIRLREAGYRQTILLLEGFFEASDLELVAEYQLTCVIHSEWQIALLDAYPKRAALDVWLKVNSGMHRLGFAPDQVAVAMEQLRRHAAVREITVMSHFAFADETRGVSDQLALINDIAAQYRVARSYANSAALLRYPATHVDWVRPGIMLYGASPFADTTAQSVGLKPVMTLSSRIIATQDLRAGDEVGYAGQFRADRAMRIGIVACGYADGYPRHAPNGTPVLVDGSASTLLGRVSMDMLCVDLTAIPQACAGSLVTLWGAGLPIEQVAAAAGTISYELMCALAARVPVRT
ncbi:MAG: alanine racemase [Gallionella sp.]|nr:alanine racemase [Gallionella sp.]